MSDAGDYGIAICCCLGIIIVVLVAGFFAEDDTNTTVETVKNNTTVEFNETAFEPENYTFVYNDGNTSEYKGDMGLEMALIKNHADNKTYAMYVDLIRGVAHDTKGTFEFDDNMTLVMSVPGNSTDDYDYRMFKLKYSNGSEVKQLRISDDHLTSDQKAYFEDYQAQRDAYDQKQLEAELEEDSENSYSSSNHKQRGFIYGPNGIGYYQSF